MKKLILTLIIATLLVGTVLAGVTVGNSIQDMINDYNAYMNDDKVVLPTITYLTNKDCWIEDGEALCEVCVTYPPKDDMDWVCIDVPPLATKNEIDDLVKDYVKKDIEYFSYTEEGYAGTTITK